MCRKLRAKYDLLPLQAKASLWFLCCSFLQKSVSALATPIFTRLLSKAEYGQFNVFVSWHSVLRVVVTLNLFYGVYSSGLIKFKERRNEFISSLEGLTLLLIVLWSVVYGLFHKMLNHLLSLSSIQVLCMLVIFWTGALFDFWSVEQRVYYRYQKLALVTLCATILELVTAILMITLCPEDKVTARILGVTIAGVCSYLWMFIAHIRQCKRLFSRRFWLYALKFNIPLIPHYLSQSVLHTADRIMIERMVSADAAGLYSLAYSVSMIMSLLNSALTQALGPWVYEKIKSREETDIAPLLASSLILISLSNIFMIILAPEIIAIFAPASYYEAIWTIPPVAMSIFFTYLYSVFSYYEFYFERTVFISFATIAAAVLNLTLNYIFIPRSYNKFCR